ncbi:hypothetical protein [Photobacterium damselae]|uniref:hypothetical protein n=1 Tax=Photobacterium damselae TaxID=38293 RepID=UPI00197B19A0
MNGHRRLLGSFNHGSMANAMAQEKGFAIYMLKAPFNGYGDELVEVAKTNLLR